MGVVLGATRGGLGAVFFAELRGAGWDDPRDGFAAGRGIGFAPFFEAAGRDDFVDIANSPSVGVRRSGGRPCGGWVAVVPSRAERVRNDPDGKRATRESREECPGRARGGTP
jgi:hypothetical protein